MLFHHLPDLSLGIGYTTCDIITEVKKLDCAKGLSKLYSLSGLEKGIVPILIPFFQILENCSINRYQGWLAVLKEQRRLYRAVLVFPTTLKMMENPSVSHALLALSAFCETCQFLYLYEACSFETYMNWAQKMGQKSFFKSNFMNHCLYNPKTFFTFGYCLWDLKTTTQRYWCYPKTAGLNPAALEELKPHQVDRQLRTQKREDLLNVAYSAGRLGLIIFRNYFKRGLLAGNRSLTTTLYLLDLGTQSTNLIKFLILTS